MRVFEYTLVNEYGLHAKPAVDLIRIAGKYKCKTFLVKENRRADISKYFVLMAIGARRGDTVRFEPEGPDENAAIEELAEYIKVNL